MKSVSCIKLRDYTAQPDRTSVSDGPTRRKYVIDSQSRCHSVSETTAHVSKMSVLNCMPCLANIDPEIPNTWLYLEKSEHTFLSECLYCQEVERKQKCRKYIDMLSGQLISIIHWDSTESESTVALRAEEQTTQFVNKMTEKYGSSGITQKYCMSNTRQDLKDEDRLILELIPGADPTVIRHEWEKFVIKTHNELAAQLRIRHFKQQLTKFIGV
ncbi:uncharacterized protein V1516DRAFT_682030 [Lipomyces oligophaga]|uniref:uncharacterized protein n=1 Tax=Lipomyces oligophaga TaxID=45792 RepID=UPI0034CEE8A8